MSNEIAIKKKTFPWEINNKYINKFNAFLTSPLYILLTGLMAVIANLFGAEIYIYTVVILIGIYVSLFGKDYLPITPLVINCYISPSLHNNPGRNADSIFYPLNGGIYLAFLVVAFVVSVVYRIVNDKELGGKNFIKAKRQLMPGLIILGCSYLLAGAFSGRYFEKGINNLLFALVQFAAVFVCYWFFCGAVKWKDARKDYFAWTGFNVGLIVCCELLGLCLTQDVISNNAINPKLIASGWGNPNNLGCMVAMMIPFAFSLSQRKKTGWIFSFASVIFIAFTCLTCSRASIGAGFVICAVSIFVSFFNKQRRKGLIVYGTIAIITIITAVIFREKLMSLFTDLIARGFDPRNRNFVYAEGFKAFLENPIFGDTFYPEKISVTAWSTLEGFDSIVPNRWHNTIIQMLASCGIVGMTAYVIHRTQTIKLFWKKRKTDTIFIGLSLGAMLLASLLDCHFFNIGPTLFYSMGLAFAEKIND